MINSIDMNSGNDFVAQSNGTKLSHLNGLFVEMQRMAFSGNPDRPPASKDEMIRFADENQMSMDDYYEAIELSLMLQEKGSDVVAEIENAKQSMIKEINGAIDMKNLGKRYPSGAHFCIAFIPEKIQKGIPSKLEIKPVEYDNSGMAVKCYVDDSAIIYLLPKEIQEKCCFDAPHYQILDLPYPDERLELVNRVSQAFDSAVELFKKLS